MRSIRTSSSRSLVLAGLLLILLFVVRLVPVAAFARTSSDWVISPTGVGEIEIGTPVETLRELLSPTITLVQIPKNPSRSELPEELGTDERLTKFKPKTHVTIAVIDEGELVTLLLTKNDVIESILVTSKEIGDTYGAGSGSTVDTLSQHYGPARLYKHDYRQDMGSQIEVVSFANQPADYEFIVGIGKDEIGNYQIDPETTIDFDTSTQVIAVVVGCTSHCQSSRKQVSQAIVQSVDIEPAKPVAEPPTKDTKTRALARTGAESLGLASLAVAMITAGLGLGRYEPREPRKCGVRGARLGWTGE